MLKRKVAIKVLHDEDTMDADLVARFFQEARAAAAIGEQHIINVIDAGELDIGRHKVCYLMMELLDGKSLWAGTSPDVVELTPTDEAVTVVVALPGFCSVTRKVTPRSDAEVLIVLTRLPVEPRKQRHPTGGDDLIKP